MKYNTILDIKKEDTGSEPVTLAEAKAHLNITFTDDDAYLTSLIKQCRKAVENFTGVSIVAKEIEVILNNSLGNMELPYGPVQDVDTEATIGGISFKYVVDPVDEIQLSYETGYDSLPEDLKLAVLNEIAFRYRNRGEEATGLSKSARELASPYKRTTWFL